MKRFSAVILISTALLLAACGGGDGLPGQAGEYVVKSKSVTFDGERYQFQWAPTGKSDLSWAKTREVRLQLDDRTFLQVEPDKKAVLHLTQEEPVTVVRKESGREYSSAWYPYYGSSTTVIVEREYRQPIYVYPPSSSFNNGETLNGSVRSDKPADPATIQKLQASSNTVSGQGGGTGGGNAVTNKAGPPPAASGGSSSAPAGASAAAPTAPSSSGPSASTAPKPTQPPAQAPAKVPSISTKK